MIVALCLLGKGNDAFKMYRRISPFDRNRIIDAQVNDRYVFNQFHTPRPTRRPAGRGTPG